MTSFPTPADNTITPTEVCSNLSSVNMRARTGNAVMEKLTPIKSRNIPKEGCDAPAVKVLYIPTAMAQPRPNGRIMPMTLTHKATRALRNMIRRSTSRPTRKRKKTRPRLATNVKFGIAAAGKMVFEKFGILPMTLRMLACTRMEIRWAEKDPSCHMSA